MSSLNHLPLEILSLIGKHLQPWDLYECSLVNKRFYTATNPLLWRTLELFDAETLQKVITSLVDARDSLGRHVRDLVTYCDGFNDNDFLLLIKHLPHLVSFTSEAADNLTDNSLHRLAHYCPNLTTLYLRLSPVSLPSIISLSQHCHQLRDVCLDACPNISSSDFFSALAHGAMTLERLQVDVSQMLDLREPRIADKAVLDLAVLDRLTELCLWYAPNAFSERIITLTTTDHIPWPHLKDIDLSESSYTHLTDRQFVAFIQSHPDLTSIALNSSLLTNTSLHAIAIYLPSVSSITLLSCRHFTHLAVRRLIRNCPRLTSFFLSEGCLWIEHFPEMREAPFKMGLIATTTTAAATSGHGYVTAMYTDDLQQIRLGPEPGDE
ncbi:hypothetical protein BCR42DRAFT_497074 [Absidia repens]|uniref:F-box domain-containing protein n=1 Tax=Absidia repens TaxID=90262 RepID=A0A1X2HWY2_9FUNG|nr:hypothetical protein BCR42DRAFT_497074 [Absidia repens]